MISDKLKEKEVPPEYTENDPLKDEKLEETTKKNFNVSCLKNVTIEPCMFIFVISGVLLHLTNQNLCLEKACRVNLNFTDEICDALKAQKLESKNEYEEATQKLLAGALATKTYISTTVPSFLALFVGSWSDKTGHRKYFLIVAMAGQLLQCINNMINVYFFKQLSLDVFVFTDAFIEGFYGGWCICFTTMFSFIGAITDNKNRTFRMGLVNFCCTVGFPIGMSISGVLLKKYSYYGGYGLAASLALINLCYTFFVLKDPPKNKEQKKQDGKGILNFLQTFFDWRNVRNTLKVILKNEPKGRKTRLFILIAVICVLFGPMHGEVSIMYMNTRYRFEWNEIKFSIFQTYNFLIHTAGTVFSILVFSKYLQWHDSILGIISTISKITSSFVYCFAKNEKIFFIAPLVDILNGTSLLAIRSILSKMVAADELGKLNSIIALTENLMPLLYVPLYTKVYIATMETVPGAVFLLGASMTLPAVITFFWLLYEHRKKVRRSILNSITAIEGQ